MTQELVVVTGGAGFIGSHTVDRLLERGCRVVVLDNFSTGKRENLDHRRDDENLRIIEVNVADGIWAALSSVEQAWQPVDRIIHLAAQTAVVTSIVNPLDDIRSNYATTVHLLEYARCRGVKKVVFASSAAVYGDVDESPVRETAPKVPLSPYGIDKLGSEMYLRYYAEVHGIPTNALRFFNVYGPRQDPKSAYSGVISIFMDRASRGVGITIFGDGEQTRDFVFVGDVSRAIVTACFSESASREPVNIGTGNETTVNQLAQLVIDAIGSKSAITHAPSRAGEIVRSCADVGAAKASLGFEAQIPIADGLKQTADWFQSQS